MCPQLTLRRLTGLGMLLNAGAYRAHRGQITLVMAETDGLDCIEAIRSAVDLIDCLLRAEEADGWDRSDLIGRIRRITSDLPAALPEGECHGT